jgi:hypothetical protein
LSGKIVHYETDRNGSGPANPVGTMSDELIRVGGINIESADRDSNNSGRGSEADIKAI